MGEVKLIPMKRCPDCGHLIPSGHKSCPYCTSTETRRPAVQQVPRLDATTPQTPPKIQPSKRPSVPKTPMSSKTKKKLRNGLIIGASLVAVALIGVFVWSKIADATLLNKSILEPLTAKQIASKSKDHPELLQYSSLFESIQEKVVDSPAEATYREVTYKQMLDYLNFLNLEKQMLREKAKADYEDYFLSYTKAIEPEINKWKEYYEQHNPNNFLKLNIHTNYKKDSGYYTIYYPGFWIELEYPKGPLKDCEVIFGLWNTEDNEWHSRATAVASLDELKEYTESAGYYFNNASSTSPDIYNKYSMKYEVRSVTLEDGTMISASDLKEIPNGVLAYLEDPTEYNTYWAIKGLGDRDFQLEEEYVTNYLKKAFEEKDKLCYQLLSMVGYMGYLGDEFYPVPVEEAAGYYLEGTVAH